MSEHELIESPPARLPVSLYVHVPFCLARCAYCDFYSQPGGVSLFAPFVDAALFEAGHWSHYDLLDDVPTLYLGGGTPTAIGTELVRLVRGLAETARLRPDAEVTVETNPETTDAPTVRALIESGVNRFSLGVQSFDDEVLRALGRPHTAARALEALRTLHASGARVSIDLICGVPGQSDASWRASLETAILNGARHVSVYPLSVEDGTPLAASVAAGLVAEPDPDVAATQMQLAEELLTAAGLVRYEVASYAVPGEESRHNRVYWTGGAYLGVGPHAASMLPGDIYAPIAGAEGWDAPASDAARVRFTRERSLREYLRQPLADPGPAETLTAAEALREDAMLGMRLAEGISDELAAEAGVGSALASLAAEGLVEHVEGRWHTTAHGWLLGNEVFGRLWAAE